MSTYDRVNFNNDYHKNLVNSLSQYKREISKFPILTAEEETELFKKYKENHDQEAKKRLFECNLKLVYTYAMTFEVQGIDTLDLIQEGNIGLMEAIDAYDLSYNTRFSTCANIWIKKNILAAIYDKSKNICIPRELTGKYIELQKVCNEIETSEGRRASVNELLSLTSLSKKEIEILYPLINDGLLKDEEQNIEEEIEQNGSIEDEVIDKLMNDSLKEFIIELIDRASLSEREIRLLFYRYGIMDGKKHTYEDTATILGCSHERVSQLEAKAFDKLKRAIKPSDLEYFKSPELVKMKVKEAKAKVINKTGKIRKNAYRKQTIYNLFKQYPSREVSRMLSKLTFEQMNIVEEKFSNKEYDRSKLVDFYENLVPTMKNMLDAQMNGTNFMSDEEVFKIGKEKLTKYIENLSIFEITIISIKYGFIDGTVKTNEEVAMTLHIPIEEIENTVAIFKKSIEDKETTLTRKKPTI